ncbi:MAG TPA: tetratricopeptide repeat protein [Candidatus Aminicenantes bacterium]|nr:tetratricopeptide repeat protein [Candidatus Aminicenantes bacterium]HRY64634.1 tetratricopeptide repeat protein [Candidatus Aminicenantes bacterium]HRZ71547.1 tetratricopeptide repeat protein [Candidatus Aminicenantes bacterium]
MDNRLSTKLAAGAAILFLVSGLALAQAGRGTGRMNGTVQDPAGKPVVGAKVTAVYTQSGGSTFETKTDKKGEFTFMGIGTGNWDVTVEAQGYLPVTQRVYTSQLNKNPKYTIKLEKKSEGTGIVQDEAAFQTLEEGNTFFKEGKYDTALLMYEEFMGKNPGAYQVLLNIGDCYREKGEFDKAIETYNKLIEQAAADATMGKNMGAKGLAAIGLCYLKKDDMAQAQDYFKKSIEMAPQDETLPYNVAEIYFSNSQIDDAIKYFEMAIQIKADWPDPYLRVAYAYLNKGDMAKAIENLEKFIQLEPETARTEQAKGMLNAIKK